MKIKRFFEQNYCAVFDNGKTLRLKFRPTQPIGLVGEEIEDVAINSQCMANCPYCYVSAFKTGRNFENIAEKAFKIWGSREEQYRPFQIAIGGEGEPTLHPDFITFIKTVASLGIMPNYTTNGMHLNDKIIKASSEFCGGVAISYHPHIKKVFDAAVRKLPNNIKRNIHIIVGGDSATFQEIKDLYSTYHDLIDYFVLLPYQTIGRGQNPIQNTEIFYNQLIEWINSVNPNQFAFGASFYSYLVKYSLSLPFQVSLYEPEIFSGYRIMDERFKTLFKSSFNKEPKYAKKNF